MTRIKMCGLSRIEDIEVVNILLPEYIGFVFYPESSRYITEKKARELKKLLDPKILTVGVFVDEKPELVAEMLNQTLIDIAQLHGNEDADYIRKLKKLTEKSIIQAFRIRDVDDVEKAVNSPADMILLDGGQGNGKVFSWDMIKNVKREFFLAGGLNNENVRIAIETLKPYAVDVSSGIETNGKKDKNKMIQFVDSVRKEASI